MALSIVPACGGRKSLSVYSIRDEAPLGPAARILVRRRRKPRSTGHRGFPLGPHAVLRGAGGAGPPGGAQRCAPRVSRRATSSPTPCPTTSTSSSGSWPRKRAGSSPSRSIRRCPERRSSASSIIRARRPSCCTPTTPIGPTSCLGHGLRAAARGGRWQIPGWATVESIVEGHPKTEPADRGLGIPISYSSGTTGQPKAVVRPGAVEHRPLGWRPTASKSFGHAFQFLPSEACTWSRPACTTAAARGSISARCNVGQGLAIVGKFDPEATLAMIDEHRVTTAYMVPTQFVRFLRLPQDDKDSATTSRACRSIVHSAAPCPLEVKKQMMEWWGPVIWETYGGMEGAATIAKPYRWLEKPGTVGRSVAGMKVKILDDEGNELPPNEQGGVYLEPERGGRLRLQGRSRAHRVGHPRQGVHPGRHRLHRRGRLSLHQRPGQGHDHQRRGEHLSGRGRRACSPTHPAVGDVAVIGVPDPNGASRSRRSWSWWTASSRLTSWPAELIAFCQERMARYKCPRSVEFRDDLPRTDAGKIYKRLLRDEYWATAERNV